MGVGLCRTFFNLTMLLPARLLSANLPLSRYARTFDIALKEAATASSSERQAKMAELLKRGDARQAHPSLDHILPIYIAAGAAGADAGEQLWTLPEGSMSWAQYRFGGVGAA